MREAWAIVTDPKADGVVGPADFNQDCVLCEIDGVLNEIANSMNDLWPPKNVWLARPVIFR
jgi:hypothetical protein